MSWLTTLGLKPSKHEFVQQVIELLRADGIDGEITYDSENFRLVIAALETQHYLHNHYAEVCRAWPWHRRATSQRFIRSLGFAKPKPPSARLEDVRSRLLPIIRDPLYFEGIRLQCLKDKSVMPVIPRQPLGGFYSLSVVIDEAERMAMVNDSHLKNWGITFEQAVAIAVRNLVDGNQGTFERVLPGLFRSTWEDNYDPSRILLPDLIAALGLRGEPVVIMPHRDCMLIADSLDEKAMGRLAELGRAEFDHPRCISCVPLILRSGEWTPFVSFAEGGEGADALKELSHLGRGQAYSEQKVLLEELHEITGKDIFVASYSGLKVKGQNKSFCTWTRGVESLLPVTDLIALCDPDRSESEKLRGLFRWSDLEKGARGSFKPVGMVPERWLTSDFPTEEQLAKLTPVG